MKDTTRHQGKRRLLLQEIVAKGITDTRVLEALLKIPRHFFMDSSFEDHAYQDKAFQIAAGQTISQPYTVAFQTQLLEVTKGQSVLEIGTGSGYQTAVLCKLGAKVFSIERQQELYKKTKLFLAKLGYRPRYLSFGDGYKGLPEYAPYDRILVTAGAPEIPKALMAQLKIGGRLVIPVGKDDQVMTLVVRKDSTRFEKTEYGDFRFVPMLEDKN